MLLSRFSCLTCLFSWISFVLWILCCGVCCCVSCFICRIILLVSSSLPCCLAVGRGFFVQLCSTSPPGGNQVDGLPPAFSFWKYHICVEIDFLPKGALRETTEESAAHHFLIKVVSEAQKLLFGSSGKNFQNFRFLTKMTPKAGQKHKNSQRNLCRIWNWIPLS